LIDINCVVRISDQTTSDDSSRYRSVDEIKHWQKCHNPITRLRNFMLQRDWWSEKEESAFMTDTRKQAGHNLVA